MYFVLNFLEKIDAQYEAELARKAQAANEVQSVVESENVAGNTVPSQYLGKNKAEENNENKDQSSSVITNQEVTATTINEPVTSVSVPKSEEVTANSEYKEGMLKFI